MRRYLSPRRIGLLNLACLAVLAAAYLLTREPAPRIRVTWREDLPPQQQAVLETRYLLLNGRDRFASGSLAYDLLDTSRANIRALVQDPAVVDTNDIERHTFVIPPDTDRGREWTWVAYRMPGLRHVWVRGGLILLLLAGAFVGLRRELAAALRGAASTGRHLTRAWNDHRRAPDGSRDLFDTIWGCQASGTEPTRGNITVKVAAAVLLLVVAGLPILETWEALALAAAYLMLVFSDGRSGLWRLAAAAGLALTVVGLKAALPRADIAEGHNAFLVFGDREPLEQGLPSPIFQKWRAQFDALYPPGGGPPPEWSWRAQKTVPKRLYADSADAIWRPAKYTRQVDTIRFRTLAEFRAGFTSEVREYNFWTGDLDRLSMPFYAMYELTPAAVGSRLQWSGEVFWERADGTFAEIIHKQVEERTIMPADAGKRVYVGFFPASTSPINFELIHSTTLRISRWIDAVLTCLGGMAVLALVMRPRWAGYLRALSLTLIAYVVLIAVFTTPSSARLGYRYFPHGGGGDGLVHESYGRTMAMLAGRGDVVEAMKGIEPVYWFTPGTRYVRMIEKLIFGDTNHLFALALTGIPVVFFLLMRRLVGALPAWIITGAFTVMPIGNFSFLQYVSNAWTGYGDGIAIGLFLLGLLLVITCQPGARHRALRHVWAGGAALAASMFIRPNFALAVVWIGCIYIWMSCSRRDIPAALALACGLAIALWMPFHNWYYGGELYLVSVPGATMSVPLGPGDYLTALRDLLAGRTDTEVAAATYARLAAWLWGEGFSFWPLPERVEAATRLLRLVTLAVTVWVAVACARRRCMARLDMTYMTGAAICAHLPMLVIFSTYHRYAMLAWDLSVIVTIAWVLRRTAGARQPDSAALHLRSAAV